ncbi:Leucine-rich repeat-containing protein ODA7 [Diplonema papillatum]|nr:Leucine-rich repeat-containing protein ODA7 [Diplonema papillatum]
MNIVLAGQGLLDLDIGSLVTSKEELAALAVVKTLDASGNKLTKVTGLQPLSSVSHVNLSRNNLVSLRGLPLQIVQLDVSHNRLTSLEALSVIPTLQTLDASHNNLTSLAGLNSQAPLRVLTASFNFVSSLQPLRAVHKSALRSLALDNNCIKDARELRALTQLPRLASLLLAGNPFAEKYPAYQRAVVNSIPSLQSLDSAPVREGGSLLAGSAGGKKQVRVDPVASVSKSPGNPASDDSGAYADDGAAQPQAHGQPAARPHASGGALHNITNAAAGSGGAPAEGGRSCMKKRQQPTPPPAAASQPEHLPGGGGGVAAQRGGFEERRLRDLLQGAKRLGLGDVGSLAGVVPQGWSQTPGGAGGAAGQRGGGQGPHSLLASPASDPRGGARYRGDQHAATPSGQGLPTALMQLAMEETPARHTPTTVPSPNYAHAPSQDPATQRHAKRAPDDASFTRRQANHHQQPARHAQHHRGSRRDGEYCPPTFADPVLDFDSVGEISNEKRLELQVEELHRLLAEARARNVQFEVELRRKAQETSNGNRIIADQRKAIAEQREETKAWREKYGALRERADRLTREFKVSHQRNEDLRHQLSAAADEPAAGHPRPGGRRGSRTSSAQGNSFTSAHTPQQPQRSHSAGQPLHHSRTAPSPQAPSRASANSRRASLTPRKKPASPSHSRGARSATLSSASQSRIHSQHGDSSTLSAATTLVNVARGIPQYNSLLSSGAPAAGRRPGNRTRSLDHKDARPRPHAAADKLLPLAAAGTGPGTAAAGAGGVPATHLAEPRRSSTPPVPSSINSFELFNARAASRVLSHVSPPKQQYATG